MAQLRFWRNRLDIGASRDAVEADFYRQAGYHETSSTDTYRAQAYTIGGASAHVDPRVWDRTTGLKAMRQAEFNAAICHVCGRYKDDTECCRNRPQPARPAPITTRPSRYTPWYDARGRPHQRTVPVIDVICHDRRKTYFVTPDGQTAGIADTADAYVAYVRTGYNATRHTTMRMQIPGATMFTAGGPARRCTRADFNHVLWGRKKIGEVTPIPFDNPPSE